MIDVGCALFLRSCRPARSVGVAILIKAVKRSKINQESVVGQFETDRLPNVEANGINTRASRNVLSGVAVAQSM